MPLSKKLHPNISNTTPEEETSTSSDKALNFILNGIGCNCLVLLSETDVLETLVNKNFISKGDIKTFPNHQALTAAFITLEKCKIIICKDDAYFLTQLGRELTEYTGLITMLFDGYGDLMSHQVKISQKQVQNPFALLRGDAIAKASIQFGSQTVDPIINREFENLSFTGTICDLGCGACTRLISLCDKTGNSGLGFDSDYDTVVLAKQKMKNSRNISVKQGDITNLQGIWEEVVILMQYFVFHDFTPASSCIQILNSYLENFPNLKYFFYVDVVAPSPLKNNIMPGYDYIHGLMGITTRTYEETIDMFEQSKFGVAKEVPIDGLPNTFLWILFPKK